MALPIPMPEEDIATIVAETDLFLEICSSGNPRMALRLMDLVKARGGLPSRRHRYCQVNR